MQTAKVLSQKLCRANPDTIFVFGDNLRKVGKKGQAVIRDCPNAFGIPTKRAPARNNTAFFSDKDDEKQAIDLALAQLLFLNEKHNIIFPEDGLGTGLAQMESKSPRLFAYLQEQLKLNFSSRRTTMTDFTDDFFPPLPYEDVADTAKEEHVKTTGDKSTQFRGVYLNTNKNNTAKYRVAIVQNSNRQGDQFWMTLGYYEDVNIAALHYNVAALGIFLGKAKLNRVNQKDCDPVELAEFKKNFALRIAISRTVASSVQANGEALNYIS